MKDFNKTGILMFCKREGRGIHPIGKDKVQGICASKAVIISLKTGYEVSGGSVTNVCIIPFIISS